MDHLIARTGRVQSWLDNSESRLPVSCTVFVVEDTMEGADGIEASWRFTSYALRHGAGVAIHLSKLRPKGHVNDQGLVASGPCSFAKIYSVLNQILRRGGIYKNGAVTLHLDLEHPDIESFIKLTREEIPWAKRCVDVDVFSWENADLSTKEALISAIQSGDVWLNKIKRDRLGKRIYGNVCLEVYLPSRGTCLLQHVNLGMCKAADLEDAFVFGMKQLCSLHNYTDVGKDNEYLPPHVDRQVGLGILGLANYLRREGISYQDLGFFWEDYHSNPLKQFLPSTPQTIKDFILEFEKAVQSAADVAKTYGMERAFAIAPTASCSYRYKDLDGYTTTPEIAPPISREVDRDSDTFGVESFDYGPVEIASEVGWENFARVADCIMRCLHSTGLLHGYSMNTWSDLAPVTLNFIEDWLLGPQTSLYYSLQVLADSQNKTDVLAALGGADSELFDDILESIDYSAPKCDCAE